MGNETEQGKLSSASEDLYSAMFNQDAFGVLIHDIDGVFVKSNLKASRMLGYSDDELLALSVKELVPVGEQQEWRMPPRERVPGLKGFVEHNLIRKDGSLLPVEITTQILPDRRVIAVINDVSRWKKSEEEIRHMSRLYATLSQVNQTIVRVRDRDNLFRTICEVAIEYGKFDLAAIGLLDESGGTLTHVESRGTSDGNPYSKVRLNEEPYSFGLSASAIRSGEVVTSECVQIDERTFFWKDQATRRQVHSVAAVPFRLDKKVVGILSLASKESGFFGPKEKSLLAEIGMDISFALDMIKLEEERRGVEEALKASEERYRSVYENTHLGLYRTTPDGRILMANPALIRMLGFESFEQLTGRDLSMEGFEPDYSRDEFIRIIERDGEIKGLETAWTRLDGRAMYIRESAKAIRDDHGNTIYFEGTIEDITEKKIAEKALRTSEDRFRNLFENAPVSLWEEDFSEVKRTLDNLRTSGVKNIREFLARNRKFLESLFDSVKILSVNKSTLSLYHAVSVLQLMRAANSVSDPDAGPAHSETIERIWKGETTYESETLIKTLTGEKRHVMLRWKVVPGFEQDYSKVLVSMSDITPLRNFERELENSREMYREIVENIDEVIFSLDAEGKLIYASPAMEHYFGPGFESRLGVHFSSFVHPDDHGMIAERFDEQRRGISTPFECRFVVREGQVRWGIVHPVPVFHRGGFTGIRGSVLDITERKEAEMRSLQLGEQLRALAAGLQTAREEERILVAREIHDELGQGLTTLKLGIALVRRSLLEHSTSKKILTEINELQELSRSVDGLVNSVRRISTSLRPEVLDELGLAEAIKWYSEQISRQSKIKCSVRISTQKIRLNDKMLTVLFRIFQEALTNVVRHSGANKAEISLTQRDGKVTLTVKDNGIGITRENIRDRRSIGLLGMEERAAGIGGVFTVLPASRKGTLVKVEVPFVEEKPDLCAES